MAEVMGIGITHYPPLGGRDEDMAGILKGRLNDPDVPAAARDPRNWPAAMREEWSDDQGRAAAARHRAAVVGGLKKARAALDAFAPDVVLIWGDDQYENFREDIVPAFCVLAYDDMVVKPWAQATESAMFSGKEDEWGGGRPNVWGERRDHELRVRGAQDIGRWLATTLLERDFDVAYAYQPLHHPGLPHAFLNSVLYLDYERKGFPYRVLPFQINCYGRAVIAYRGYVSRIAERGRTLDPPSPSPRRGFQIGAAVAEACRASPWRVALVASSSWSHAFLNESTHRLQPDMEFDRRLYEALQRGDWEVWKKLTVAQLEAAGDQELLNWCALGGAAEALGLRCTWSEFASSYVFNSNKVTAIFEAAPKA